MRDPQVAELTDFYWDGELGEGSLERPANVALPYLR
jgi:hypothetical protein